MTQRPTPDRIETHGACVWQHGPLNSRVYVMHVGDDPEKTAVQARNLAREHGYGKVFAKVPAAAEDAFRKLNYTREATIPGYYADGDACRFMGLFLDPQRAERRHEAIDGVLKAAADAGVQRQGPDATPLALIRTCTAADAPAMAELYAETFETYPFPIWDPAYIVSSMQSHVIYSGIWHEGRLIGLSSAECDNANQAVEMTDFAVAPAARGNRLATALLAHMENQMRTAGFRTAFTIARAISYGMNITFARQGYTHGGLLVNNTSICGQMESMNVWHKSLESK